jgi:glycosyltransferase involved in cell wall biosynthesis
MNNERNRILIFSAFYPPHLGGVERYTQQLSKALIKRGNKVSVVTSSFCCVSETLKALDSAALEPEIIRLPSVSLFGDRFPLLVICKEFAKGYKKIVSVECDSIVINTRYYPLSVLAAHIAKKKGIRPIVIDHSSGRISNEKNLFGCTMRLYERCTTGLIGRSNPVYCSVSRRGFEWLVQLGLRPNGVIFNSIDADAFRQLASKRNWRNELECTQDTFVLVYSGRLIPEKGVLKLVQALSSQELAAADIRLVFAGDGPLADKVRECVDKRVKYVGRLTRADLSALLRDCNCLCLPTSYPEGLPTVLLEAASQCCAIIVSDCAGAREVVPNRGCGIVLEENTCLALISAILSLYRNRDAAKLCGHNVCKHIERCFSWEAAAASLNAECLNLRNSEVKSDS